jgi:hypothetical protein
VVAFTVTVAVDVTAGAAAAVVAAVAPSSVAAATTTAHRGNGKCGGESMGAMLDPAANAGNHDVPDGRCHLPFPV